MRLNTLMAVGVLLAGFSATSAYSGGYEITQVSKATLGTNTILLWHNTSIEPDCSPHGKPTLTVLQPPEHGQAVIDSEPFYYPFPTNDPRAGCNKVKVPGNQAFYTASPGFVGHDHLVLQGFQSSGQVRRIEVEIDVRPDVSR